MDGSQLLATQHTAIYIFRAVRREISHSVHTNSLPEARVVPMWQVHSHRGSLSLRGSAIYISSRAMQSLQGTPKPGSRGLGTE